MSSGPREATLQSLDPLGALAGRPLTVAGAAAALLVAVPLALSAWRDVTSPALAVAALVVLAAAGLGLVISSAAERAPLSQSTASAVVAAGLLAHILAVAALWERNTLVRDDWGPVAIGVLLLSLSPYRPTAELVRLTVGAALLVAFVTFLQQPFFTTNLPAIAFVVIAVTPVLALGVGGAVFASVVLRRLARWRERAVRASQAHAATLQQGIVRSVQQGRVSILNREVVPFFSAISERRELTPDDQRRATEIASAIRAVMVAETERTWLDELLLPAPAGTGQSVWPRAVDDPARLVEGMDFDQRAAMRAFLGVLTGRAGIDPRALRIRVRGTPASAEIVLTVPVGEDMIAATIAPYVAVLRAVFAGLTLTIDTELTLRFTYDAD